MKKAIIVGASSPLKTAFLEKESGYFVACDKGYEAFLSLGKEPDLLVGDFDTLDRRKVKNPGKTIVLNPIKDDTDVFFAVKHLLASGYDTFSFYGCLGGGRIEHEIANIAILNFLKKKGCEASLFTNDLSQMLFVLQNEKKIFPADEKGFLSVFAQEENVIVSEKNLKYELSDYNLSPFVPLGVSNEFLEGKEGTIEVRGGNLLVIKECHEYR